VSQWKGINEKRKQKKRRYDMRGSVVKKGNKYYAVLAIGSKRKWIKGGDTRKDAERVLNENLPSVQDGTFRDIKKVTFREFGKIWIDSYVKTNIKETGYPEYVYIVGRLTRHFNDAPLQSITGAHLQAFIAKRLTEVQASTTQRETIILKEILKHAYQWGYTKRNPGEFIKNPRKPKKEKQILDIAEAYKLLDHIDPYYRVATLTAILTGVRPNELWGLTWDNIDFNNNMIRLKHSLWRGKLYEPKTKKSIRKIDISATLALELKKWKLQCPTTDLNLVFPSRCGRPVTHNNFAKIYFKKALTNAELKPVTWESLRHTNTSIRIQSGQNPKYLSEQLGHSSIKITYDVYGHLFNDAEFSRSQVEKLENSFYGR
jgi:integrase